MEGHQDNSGVSRNQSTNSDVSGRKKRAVQPNSNHRDYVRHDESDSDISNISSTNRQRGTQPRAGTRGGRGRRTNGGNDIRTTRANSDLRDNDNPSNSNDIQNMNGESDMENEDLQIAEFTETMREVTHGYVTPWQR